MEPPDRETPGPAYPPYPPDLICRRCSKPITPDRRVLFPRRPPRCTRPIHRRRAGCARDVVPGRQLIICPRSGPRPDRPVGKSHVLTSVLRPGFSLLASFRAAHAMQAGAMGDGKGQFQRRDEDHVLVASARLGTRYSLAVADRCRGGDLGSPVGIFIAFRSL